MIREILKYPEPLLAQRTEYVEDPTAPEIQELCQDLWDTVHHATGRGLAAPQIGVSKRVTIAFLGDGIDAKYYTLINPIIRMKAPVTDVAEEGCLSIPGLGVPVERSTGVLIEYQDMEGEPHSMEADGFDARVLQHEIDHLNGILMWDHLSDFQRRRYRQKFQRMMKFQKREAKREDDE